MSDSRLIQDLFRPTSRCSRTTSGAAAGESGRGPGCETASTSEVTRELAKDSFPVAIVIGVHAVFDVVLDEEQQGRKPELPVLEVAENTYAPAKSAVVNGDSSGVRTSVAMRR